MIPIEHIHPLTDFKRNTAAFRRRLKKTGQPTLLTVEGRPDMVVLDAAAYEKLLETVDRAEAIAGIQRGLESLREGKGRPASEFFDELRRKRKTSRRRSR